MTGTRRTEAGGGRPRRALGLPAIGVAAALAAAAARLLSLSGGPDGAPPEGAAATVNGVPILAAELERLVAGVEGEHGAPLGDADRRHLLERLIEEELLVQRGLDLGLARGDRRVRAALVEGVIQAATAEAEARLPEPGELRAFHAEQRDVFAQPGRLRVRQIFVADGNGAPAARGDGEPPRRLRPPAPAVPAPRRGPPAGNAGRRRAGDDGRSADGGAQPAAVRARQARRRLAAGEPFAGVRRALGDAEPAPLPDAPLPPAKLREYVGPAATRAALELEVGGVSEPVRSGAGWRVLELVDREPERVPAFEEIEELVRAEWRRRAGDRALRDYIDALRERADVAVAPARAEPE